MGDAWLQLRTDSNEVQFRHLLNYKLFKEELDQREESELRFLEKFYAARLLIECGCNKLYVNARLTAQCSRSGEREIMADVCGIHEDGFILAFCETAEPTLDLYNKLKLLASIDGVKTLLLYPFTINSGAIIDSLPPETAGKIMIEQVPWLDEELGASFQEAMKFVSLLCNETRVKMLLPLLERSKRKREYRERINPKLVYENITYLVEHKLLREFSSNEYTLTPIGRQILGEYLAFIQRIKRALKEIKR